MVKNRILIGLAGLLLLGLTGFAVWLGTLPPAAADAVAPPVPRDEAEAMLSALRPVGRERPLVAIVGLNEGTETTDYLLPAAVLRRADVADVVMLAVRDGPVQLYPVLKVAPDATVARFDALHPEGADYVIVPAMKRRDDPAVLAWLRRQASKGAKIIGVCIGATVVGEAGLLEGRRATTHWFAVKRLEGLDPTIRYTPDRRFVADGHVVTTTGVTASAPMMLTLVEAIAGRGKAEAVARDLGIERWDARHASAAFGLTRPFATRVLLNRLAFPNHETWRLALRPGVDEVSLALAADAWSRTYRSKVTTYAVSAAPIRTAHGVSLLADQPGPPAAGAAEIVLAPRIPAMTVLDQTLAAIGARYGEDTAAVVAMQLEYPRRPGGRPSQGPDDGEGGAYARPPGARGSTDVDGSARAPG